MMTKIYLYLPYPDVYAIYLVPEHIVIINLDHHGTTKVTILITEKEPEVLTLL